MPNTTEIREILNASYSRDHWQTLLTTLFPDGSLSLLRQPEILTASHEKVTATCQLGAVTLPGDDEKIALLEITTTDQVQLARNRVSLRNFVASFIDQANASAVLAVFQQPNSSDWRLTFAAKKTTLDQDTFEITTVETAPRRFTFLLGENESCKTAAARLNQLVEKQHDLNLADLEGAFSVESLTKDFFKKYKEHYHTFIKDLFSAEKASATRELFEITEEDDDYEKGKVNKPVRDFVKTLLGRLVFLTFLQKKGWLGCPANSKQWKGGDPNFLQSFLQQARDADEDDIFHSKYLTDLFFDALNNDERKNDIFSLTNSRLPYLNGGLFDDADDHARSVDFPPLLFQNLLNFFDEYNFTIDENDPEDHEVGIDPEMLGMIFENLLEDNKEKGTYYTPKAIVSYMARQSLLHYLQTHLEENQALEELLNKKDSENLPEFVSQHKDDIVKLLEKVTICDPAIGSGAFPIGLLHEILWTRLTLEPEKNNSKDRAELKRSIIQNSIHGVDLDPGAIEIARLRFWLALVVDEDKPRPLPNLDYKIHRADSLIEYIRGEAVNLGTETPTDPDTKNAVAKLIQAKQDLFTAQGLPGKRKAWFQLYRALSQLAQAEFTWMRNDANFADEDRIHQLDQNAKAFGQWINKIDSIQNQKVHLQEHLLSDLRQWFDDPNHPTFLWNLHFGGIFADGGFDIVIANPPYVRTKAIPSETKSLLWEIYPTFVKKADLLVCFIEKSIQIAKSKGTITIITSSSYLRLDSFVKIRQHLLNCGSPQSLVEFTTNVFETAAVKTAILTYLKDKILDTVIARVGGSLDILTAESSTIPLDYWRTRPNALFDTNYSSERVAISEKIRATSPLLKEIFDTSFGLKTGDDSIFLSRTPFAENSEKIYRGRNVTRWITSWNKEFVNYDPLAMREHRKTARPGSRSRFEQSKILVRDTGSCLEATYDGAGLFVKDVIIISLKETHNHLSLQATTALLNSTSVRYYYESTFQTLHVQQSELRDLPIPNLSFQNSQKLATLADQCATAATNDDQASLAIYEAEINQIVYTLFDLTEAEINLIETSLGIETKVIPFIPKSNESKLTLPKEERQIYEVAQLSWMIYLRNFIQLRGQQATLKLFAESINYLTNPDTYLTHNHVFISKSDHKQWHNSYPNTTMQGLFQLVGDLEEAEEIVVDRETLQISFTSNSTLLKSELNTDEWISYDLELIQNTLSSQDGYMEQHVNTKNAKEAQNILAQFAIAQ